MKPRTILGNLPVIGRHLYPLRNKQSIFHKVGDLNSPANSVALQAFPHAKLIVIGLPKSGNVWLQNLIGDALEMERVLLFKQQQKSGVGITHKPFTRKLAQRTDFARGVYIMRDLRDIVLSYYHYSQTDDYHQHMDPHCHYSDVEHFYFEYFLHRVVPRYDWFNHATEYLTHGLPMVKYEDLWDQPEAELVSLFKRWGLEVDAQAIAQAVADNQLRKLKQEGKKTHRVIPQSHFRKGGYGGYKSNLPANVRKDIETRFGDYLLRWGYTLD